MTPKCSPVGSQHLLCFFFALFQAIVRLSTTASRLPRDSGHRNRRVSTHDTFLDLRTNRWGRRSQNDRRGSRHSREQKARPVPVRQNVQFCRSVQCGRFRSSVGLRRKTSTSKSGPHNDTHQHQHLLRESHTLPKDKKSLRAMSTFLAPGFKVSFAGRMVLFYATPLVFKPLSLLFHQQRDDTTRRTLQIPRRLLVPTWRAGGGGWVGG